MRQIIINADQAGQRLDKFLHKYLSDAPGSFFYKMMRKKNIVLNGAKCSGAERLQEGDELKLFLSEETFELFGAGKEASFDVEIYRHAYAQIGRLPVCYEDNDILAVNKSAGILSQKAKEQDISLNEWLTGYLLSEKKITPQTLLTFHPSVCNRLDRNTSGLVLCAKSLQGAQALTAQIRERKIRKFYRLFIRGIWQKEAQFCAWLKKDSQKNEVEVLEHFTEGAEEIKTGIRPLKTGFLPGCGPVTYAEAELFTGKTHQIRAHLSYLGHPLLGDYKYGDKKLNEACRKLGVRSQLLHACRVEFGDDCPAPLDRLADNSIIAELPEVFQNLLTLMVER